MWCQGGLLSDRSDEVLHVGARSITPPLPDLALALWHPVADAGFGENVLRAVGIPVQLAAQLLHVAVHVAPSAEALQASALLQQVAEGQYPPCVEQQFPEQRVLGGGQTHGTARHADLPRRVVDGQVARHEETGQIIWEAPTATWRSALRARATILEGGKGLTTLLMDEFCNRRPEKSASEIGIVGTKRVPE